MASRRRRNLEKHEARGGAAEEPQEAAAAVASAVPATPFHWRLHCRLIAALWLWALLPYSNSFRTGFPLDNAYIILKDTRIRAATAENLHLIWAHDYWYKISIADLYRPLTTMTYLLNYAVMGNGAHAAGYHVINFSLHAVNIALVYLLGLVLFGETAPAWALAALWGVHPVLTESVTNIVGRADLLAGFGVLAGLLCHIHAGRAAGRRKAAWLGGLGLATAAGMFSKESAIVVLGAMAIYDLAYAGWRGRVWGYAAAGLPVLWFLHVRAQVLAGMPVGLVPFTDNPLSGAGFWTARLTAMGVIGHYLGLLIWPRALSADYSYNQIPLFTWTPGGWGDWAVMVSLVVCAGAGAMALWSRRRNRALFFFILFFFATLAPTANFFLLIGTIMAERFLYLPAIGAAGVAVLGIFALTRRLAPGSARALVIAAVTVLCLALGGRTFARNFDWMDDRSLWVSAEKAAPASFKVHLSLVGIMLDAKPPDLDGAVAEADRGLAILGSVPDEWNAARPYAVAGACYRQKGDSLASAAEREPWYRKALATLEAGERIDRLVLRQVERLNPGTWKARVGWQQLYMELGLVRLRTGDPRKALEALQYGQWLNIAPEFFEETSHAYGALGDQRQAAIALMEALVYDPSLTRFASLLVDLYKRTDPQSCAVRDSGGAASLNLGCPLVHDELCAASRDVELLYLDRGALDKAGATANSAVRELGCPSALFR